MVSQQGNHGDHRAQTCNGRSEHTKQRHKATAQFRSHRTNGRTQHVQPCACKLTHVFDRADRTACQLCCAADHLVFGIRQNCGAFRLAKDVPHLRKSVLSVHADRAGCHSPERPSSAWLHNARFCKDPYSGLSDISEGRLPKPAHCRQGRSAKGFHAGKDAGEVDALRTCNAGQDLLGNAARLYESATDDRVAQCAYSATYTRDVLSGARVFQQTEHTAVRAGFQNVIYKAGLPLLGSAAQSLEVFHCCPDAYTSAVQRLPDFAQARCGLLCSDASHLCTILCIFCEHSGVRPGKRRAAHRVLDQACGGQSAQQVSDRDAAERSAGCSARLSSDHDVSHRGQQRASCAVCRGCKAHGSQRCNNGRNGSRHFLPMLRCVVDAFLYPRQRRLCRFPDPVHRTAQQRQH